LVINASANALERASTAPGERPAFGVGRVGAAAGGAAVALASALGGGFDAAAGAASRRGLGGFGGFRGFALGGGARVAFGGFGGFGGYRSVVFRSIIG
jgi:hypothetical protein